MMQEVSCEYVDMVDSTDLQRLEQALVDAAGDGAEGLLELVQRQQRVQHGVRDVLQRLLLPFINQDIDQLVKRPL